MKQKTIYLLLFLITLGIESCSKDDFMQLSPGSQEKVIDVNMYDINLRFYLQNEQGEQATTFKQGENFAISWSLINNRESEAYIDNDFPPDEIGRVYKSDGTLVGKADGYCDNRTFERFIILFPYKNIAVFYLWMQDDINIQQPLPPGKYYVGFNFNFDLTRPENEHYKNAVTGDKKFRIYFNVE